MSVQELLKKQASEFMSLHETLRRMMATDGSSYAEAAQALSYSLQADEKTRPAWQTQTVITPCSPLEEKSIPEAWQCLNQAASQGVAPILPSVDGGDYENLREFYESWGDILHRGYFIEYGFSVKDTHAEASAYLA